MANRDLIMVRGLPGSGKSTVAALFNAPVCTADDYMMVGDEYVFHPSKLGYAHDKCKQKCKELMEAGIARIVVANTSVTKAELAPYYDMARQNGYRVHSLIVENRANTQNVHNVPADKVEAMRSKFDIKL